MATWLAVSALALGVLLGCGLIEIVRQQGRMLLAAEDLRARLVDAEDALRRLQQTPEQDALAVGTPAPDFALPDLKGRVRRLADYRGRPALIVFFDPECGFCAQLAPRLRHDPSEEVRLIVISRGDIHTNQALAQAHGWRGVVLTETD